MKEKLFFLIISSILKGCNTEKPIPIATLECSYLTENGFIGIVRSKWIM